MQVQRVLFPTLSNCGWWLWTLIAALGPSIGCGTAQNSQQQQLLWSLRATAGLAMMVMKQPKSHRKPHNGEGA